MSKTKKPVKEQKKNLKILKKNRSELEIALREILIQYDNKAIPADRADNFLIGLPIQTLNESLNKDYGKNLPLNLQTIKSRSLLRKQMLEKQEALQKLNEMIYLAEIEVVIENIAGVLTSEVKT